jgi:ribosome-associated protein
LFAHSFVELKEKMTQEKSRSPLPARQKAEAILAWLVGRKAHDPKALDLGGKSPVTDVIVIASASSPRQARALADGLMELCRDESYEFLRMEGYQGGVWVLADLNAVIVHIFQEPARELYNLESLWRDAEPFFPPASLMPDDGN